MGASFQVIKNSIEAEEPVSRIAEFIFNHIPQMTFPGGEWLYEKSVTRFGENFILAPHNLWRALWHIVAGFLFGLCFLFISPKWGVSVFILILMLLKEYLSDVKYDQGGRWNVKNVFDPCCWALGGLGIYFI